MQRTSKCTFLLLVAWAGLGFGISRPAAAADDARPFGIESREPFLSSKIKGMPDPPPPYRLAVAFPNLKFNEPLAMCRGPGSNRLFVVERFGKIFSFENDPQVEQADLLIDVGKTTYGLALHPQFQ